MLILYVLFKDDKAVDSTLNRLTACHWSKTGWDVRGFPVSPAHGVPVTLDCTEKSTIGKLKTGT